MRRTFTRLLPALVFGAYALHGAPAYVVSGVVVDSGSHAALANARVTLAPALVREQKTEQITKPDGRFSFGVGAPGKYILQMIKPGYPLQSYKQAVLSGISSAIAVRDGQDTSQIVFDARHGGVISGQIKDEDSEPVGNAQVAIFQSAVVGGTRKLIAWGQRRANAAGEFRYPALPRGNYFVCATGQPWFADTLIGMQQMEAEQNRQRAVRKKGQANDPPEELALPGPMPKFSPDPAFRGTAFATTFYPHAQRAEEASLVRLDTGSEAQVSITLPLARALTVKGTISVPGEVGDGRLILYQKFWDQYVLFLEAWVGKDGAFEFSNVPAGSYEIIAASQASSGTSSWHIRQQVEVGMSDMELTLKPTPMSSLAGRVLFEGDAPASMSDLFVYLRNTKGRYMPGEVSAGGTYSLSRVPSDGYDVTGGNRDYIAAYFTGSAGERLPLTLEIPAGATVRRDLTLTRAAGVIEGTVEKAGTPETGAFVLLMPKNAAQWAYRVDQTDSDGSYRLATIPAGDYWLIALSEGEEVVYRDAKVAAILAKAAKPVHLAPGDRLDLKLDLVNTAALRLPAF